MEIWKQILRKLKENNKVLLLLVVSHKGSSPGKQGFKMLVSEDDYLYGSIGGGRTEFNLVETAKNLLKKGLKEAFFQNQIHRDEEIDSSGMICAGEQMILYYPMNSTHISVLEEIINKDAGVLSITNSSFRLDVDESIKKDFLFTKKATDNWEFKERINRKAKVYLIGGGHVGLSVARLFATLDFEVTMLDDRKDLNTFEANTYSTQKKIIDYEQVSEHIEEGDNSYVVILTHGHHADKLIFSKLLAFNYKYVGILGSKAKIKSMFKTMIAEGCDEKKMLLADAPIGIPINSKTPAEIAVSIAAKIIKVRNS